MLHLAKFKMSETYKVRFNHPRYGLVVGWLKSPPKVTTSSQWGNSMEQQFGGGMTDTAAQWASGRSLTMGQFTVQKWQGAEPVNVSFDLGYVAIEDAYAEVVEPAKTLQKFPLPPTFSPATLILPVDPHVETCYAMGSWFVIKDLLPESVDVEWSHSLSKSGHPISCAVGLTFKTSRVMSAADIDEWYLG